MSSKAELRKRIDSLCRQHRELCEQYNSLHSRLDYCMCNRETCQDEIPVLFAKLHENLKDIRKLNADLQSAISEYRGLL